jgi:uncharacterized protein with HEPN domain
MRRDLAYLEDIVEASDTIAEFIRDQDMESFLSSPMLKSALAFQFTIIGEAAARVAGDLRERHPVIPWAKAKGMRNTVVHHYFRCRMGRSLENGNPGHPHPPQPDRRSPESRVSRF